MDELLIKIREIRFWGEIAPIIRISNQAQRMPAPCLAPLADAAVSRFHKSRPTRTITVRAAKWLAPLRALMLA